MKLSRQRKRKLLSRVLSEGELMDVIEEATLFGVEQAVHSMSVTMAQVLRDKIGLSKPKTVLALTQMAEYIDSVQKGYVSIKDVEESLLAEDGIEFVQGYVRIRRKNSERI